MLREWIYSWYSSQGKDEEAREYARTRRYKLYGTGELYDVQQDRLEQHRLSDSELDDEKKRVRSLLQHAIEGYGKARFSSIASLQQS